MSFMDSFDKAEPAPEYKPLPAGFYQARVVSGSYQQTKKGDDAYKIVFEVSEGEHKGRRVPRTYVFTDKAVTYSKRDLAPFRLTTAKQFLEPWPPLGIEVYCRLLLALQRGNDGSEFNDIKRIDNHRFVDSAAKNFLIDPDKNEGGSK